MFSLDDVVALLAHYRYAVLFPLVIVEGPIVTVLAGLLVSFGKLAFWWVYAVAIVGDLTGDIALYFLGALGKRGIAGKWGRWMGLTENRLEKMEHHFKKHLGKTLILGKLAHGVGAGVLLGAGAARVSFGRFFWYNFVATLPKSLFLLFLGVYFGYAYERIARYLDLFALIGLCLVVGLAVWLFAVVKRKARNVV